MKLVGRIVSLVFLATATVLFIISDVNSLDLAFWFILLAILVDRYVRD